MLALIIVTNLALALGLAAAVESWMADRRAAPASEAPSASVRVRTWPRSAAALDVVRAAGVAPAEVHGPVWGDASVLVEGSEAASLALVRRIAAHVEADGFRVLRQRRDRTLYRRGTRILAVDVRPG